MGKKKIISRRPSKRYKADRVLPSSTQETSFCLTGNGQQKENGLGDNHDIEDTLPETYTETESADQDEIDSHTQRSGRKNEFVRPANSVVRAVSVKKGTTTKGKNNSVPKKGQHDSFSKDDKQQDLAFGCFDMFIYVFCICTYLADIGSDVYLAFLYFTEKKWVFFALTLAFTLVPAVINSCFSLVWYLQDSKFYKENDGEKTSLIRWIIRMVFITLQISPVLRYLEVLTFGCKSRRKGEKRQYYEDMMLNEDSDAALLRLLECFMESAPQLTLQLYILCTFGVDNNELLKVVQIVSCFTSLASLAWALTSYHRSLRLSLQHKADMGYIGMGLQFVWRFFTVGCRVIALALFACVYGYWVFVFVGCHWFVMFVWILLLRTHFCNSKCHEVFFNVVIAIVYIFCFLNVLEGHTRLRYFLYYLLVYFENAGLIFGWYIFAHTESPWYLEPALATVLGGFFLGIFFQIIYYLFFHPNNSPPINPKKRIQLWVPLRILCTIRSKDEDESFTEEISPTTGGQQRMLDSSKYHNHHVHSALI